jgi:hypothetical protein
VRFFIFQKEVNLESIHEVKQGIILAVQKTRRQKFLAKSIPHIFYIEKGDNVSESGLRIMYCWAQPLAHQPTHLLVFTLSLSVTSSLSLPITLGSSSGTQISSFSFNLPLCSKASKLLVLPNYSAAVTPSRTGLLSK